MSKCCRQKPTLILTFILSVLFSPIQAHCSSDHHLPVFRFEPVDVEDMLKYAYILKVVQDHQGFIWIASQDGLYRYDGYQLKIFKHDPQDAKTLPSNYIFNLFVDSDGDLWIAAGQMGISRYNPLTETFTRYLHDKHQQNSISHNMVTDMAEGSTGKIWIATYGGGVNILDKASGKITRLLHDPQVGGTLVDNKVTYLSKDNQGRMWLGTHSKGAGFFDVQATQFTHVPVAPVAQDHPKRHKIIALQQDHHDRLWATTAAGGLSFYDPEQGMLVAFHDANFDIDSHIIYEMVEDAEGSLWMASRYGGLLRLNKSRNRVDNFRHHPLVPNSLPSNHVFSLTIDSTDIIWLSMFSDGLVKFNPNTSRFGKVSHRPYDPDSITKGSISAIWQDTKGDVWVGSETGLDRRNSETGKFKHYRHEPKVSDSISDNDIVSIFEDAVGTIWIGTQHHGLNRLKEDGSGFVHYRHHPDDPTSLPDDSVFAIGQDRHNNLWIGTSEGLARFDPSSESFIRFSNDVDDQHSLSHDVIYVIRQTRDGQLWIGTGGGGLNLYNEQQQNFRRFIHHPEQPNSLSNNRVYSIFQDITGTLWIGTAGGLNRYDITSGQFSHFREKDGLSSDGVFNITDDARGNLWLGLGEKSIAIFNPKTGDITDNIGQQAGCAANQGALHKAADGKLYFANRGYCAFYPLDALMPGQPPKLAFTEFYLLHKPVAVNADSAEAILTKAINHTSHITLSHEDNVMTFEFAALHFAEPSRNRYRYKLEGFDSRWIETNAKRRRTTYTNLPPGQYTFKINGSNNRDTWSSYERSIALTVLPAPWQTWWAYLLYFLLTATIIGVIAHQRYLKGQALLLAKNNAELAKTIAEKANRAKTLFVADISHEIRTPLNAVLGYTQMLELDPTLSKQHKRKLSIIEKSGNHLLGLINDILDIAKIEANAMTLLKEDFELVDLLRSIVLMLKVRTEDKKLALIFDNQCPKILQVNGDQGKLRQILINLLANAVKFTDSGIVTLTLSSPEPNQYRFEVKDTGIGIPPMQHEKIFQAFGQTDEGIKKGGTGLGLNIAWQQVRLMGGELKLESELGSGSRFYFTIELKQSHQKKLKKTEKVMSYSKLAPGSKVSALVVEDSQESIELLSTLLELMNIQVNWAQDGERALKYLDQCRTLPDIIFVDIKMPVMDGVTLFEQLQRRYGEQCPPCIAISAHAMPDDIKYYGKIGFTDYITKPFRFETIFQCISERLDVEFEAIEVTTPNSESRFDPAQLKVPAKYLNRLKSVAADYEITLLEECMEELSGHCEDGRLLSECIKPYLNNYDMDGLLKTLAKVECEDG